MDKRPHSSQRDALQARILQSAVAVFAEAGYAGSSVASIAERAGISKQNLLYYFANKQCLYQTVLDRVLDQWLERMDILADQEQEPAQLLRSYIAAKLRFSREQPQASRVYAMEVISGAPIYGARLREKILPLLKKDIAVFELWISQGKIAAVNPTHLLFLIWAMTQSYADFSMQMSLVLGHSPLLEGDFLDAEQLIVDLILQRLQASRSD
ncbi:MULTISPECIES: TetR/AcrR family transcriptional regulator [unclassified Undibacterium]|uniref:TetR/AcrR family transcriptional regulator n=1 Tax=unclassified Undibacterium TaxID=2630295 RepID=UPI002AC8FFBA|nr:MULTISPECIES: TetR/AcrR family transcriptional regulator [unclassified Undibacterium]MEB0138129.1 TetR/AcrR family transcriptional regulator [Undibacterium sp. CCC2.1]MEB0171116.1 TetR/AcrR family transcriptional regulator [Undibacterium sp. CCC1.1]MEB0175161.1 TetR/AcrR family transcriptional regulator [Undibacterium sp. CCC3.4]MEB0214255.1 TetR/AcrR family transcriptional regulator [Undibacterium sp. 5I2]WPX41835.1 TetR/AcrR family transcriptional regulator [Undibacterium sp. CCC3.4]